MFVRYLTSVAIGSVITSSLLFLMHVLIEVSEAVETSPRERHDLSFVSPMEDSSVEVVKKKPPRVDPPAIPPPLVAPTETQTNGPRIGFRQPPEMPLGPKHDRPTLGISNNVLVTIFTVRPIYPISATRLGLEGIVVVKFDVTKSGAVSNVSIVESSDRIFDKAAKDATYRFRYKARVVDGVPVVTEGVQTQFRFKMDET
jgi:protein TonB